MLADEDIANYLEQMPSDDDSCCSVESDQETGAELPRPMLLGDVVGEGPQTYSSDEEDNEPLSSFRSMQPPGTTTSAAGTSSSRKNYTLSPPGEFTGNAGVPVHILDLENITPLALFRMFWSNDLQELL